MPLGLNPIVNRISQAANLINAGGNQSGGTFGGINFGTQKASLDAKVNQLGGGIGSPLNGFTAGTNTGLGGNPIQNAIGGIANVASDVGRAINNIGGGGALGGIGQLAGAISSAAGQLNNVLSVFRGRSLPADGELFSQVGSGIQVSANAGDDWRVRINANFGLFGGAFSRLQDTGGVVWPYNPSITISTKANYQQIDPVHSNYPFQAYKSSAVESISISGDFSCETETDALYWLEATHFFRSATKMFFGASTYAGNPPVVCQLTGYGAGVFNSVPVVINSFSVDLPEDVNYIRCYLHSSAGSTFVPILSKISVTVTPIYNRTDLRKFSLQNFAKGQALGYL
jgi:hypothetical protein